MRAKVTTFLLLVLLSEPTEAGVFVRAPLDTTEPFIIVHPTVYTGTGGHYQLSVCGTSSQTRPTIRRVITLWNERRALQGNCLECALLEDPFPTGERPPHDMDSVVLHELGHCGFGLEHPTWISASGLTSFTNSQEAVSISAGSDSIRGSKDDVPNPLPGTRLVHWFRMADNDPIAIDSTTIDGSTYSRRILDLPKGSRWPANANRCVSESLLAPPTEGAEPCPAPPPGTASTQALMYPALDAGMRFSGLAADDVNTAALAMTGLDLQAGTEDDYSITLVYTNDCLDADIRIDFVPVDGPGETLGVCTSDIEPIGPETLAQIHYRLVPSLADFQQLVIEVDVDENWNVLFVGDFEGGDVSEWSESFSGSSPSAADGGELHVR